jgi:hypothetical protein
MDADLGNVLLTRGSQPVAKEGLIIRLWRLQFCFALSPPAPGHCSLFLLLPGHTLHRCE